MRLRELSTTIEAGEKMRFEVLRTVASNLDGWINRLMREKATYHAMNKLSIDSSRKVLVGEAWVPVEAWDEVKEALRTATEASSAQVCMYAAVMLYSLNLCVVQWRCLAFQRNCENGVHQLMSLAFYSTWPPRRGETQCCTPSSGFVVEQVTDFHRVRPELHVLCICVLNASL